MTNPEPTTRDDADSDGVDNANATQPAPNLSTDHQPQGDAARPAETLDRDRPPPQDDGGRKSSLTK